MARFDVSNGNPEKERLDRLAERVQALTASLDLKSDLTFYIYRALDAERVMDQATRLRLIPEIKEILLWQGRPPAKRADHEGPQRLETGNLEDAAQA